VWNKPVIISDYRNKRDGTEYMLDYIKKILQGLTLLAATLLQFILMRMRNLFFFFSSPLGTNAHNYISGANFRHRKEPFWGLQVFH
jgi:hypothetical protein